MERFIEADKANVELFFNIFTFGIESFIIPWDQLSYPRVLEVFHMEMEPLSDTHLGPSCKFYCVNIRDL